MTTHFVNRRYITGCQFKQKVLSINGLYYKSYLFAPTDQRSTRLHNGREHSSPVIFSCAWCPILCAWCIIAFSRCFVPFDLYESTLIKVLPVKTFYEIYFC